MEERDGASGRAGVWSWLGGAAALLLAAGLAWRGLEAHRANVALFERLGAVERESEQLRAEGERLRSELDALRSDPLYVERMLRGAHQAAPGEVVVENPPAARARSSSRSR